MMSFLSVKLSWKSTSIKITICQQINCQFIGCVALKDEGKPSFKFELYTVHKGLREAFVFLYFCIIQQGNLSLERFLSFDALFG